MPSEGKSEWGEPVACLRSPCCSMHACVLSRVQLFCDPMDCSPPGSSVHGIFQARMLEWVAILFCRGSSPFRDGTLLQQEPQ